MFRPGIYSVTHTDVQAVVTHRLERPAPRIQYRLIGYVRRKYDGREKPMTWDDYGYAQRLAWDRNVDLQRLIHRL